MTSPTAAPPSAVGPLGPEARPPRSNESGPAPIGGGPGDGGETLATPPGRWTRHFGTAVRLAGLHAVVLVAILTASVIAVLRTTAVGVEGIAVGQLGAEVRSFQQAAVARPAGTTLREFSTTYLRSHAVPGNDLLAISAPRVWAVANGGGSPIVADPGIATLLRSIPARTSVSARRVGRTNMEVLAAPVAEAGRPAAVFVATVDLTDLQAASSGALRLALAEAAIALLAGVASAYLLLRRLLKRIGRITRTADRIGRGRLAERLGDQGTGDEVGHLASSFDSMLDSIEAAVTAQHELLSDVSHQLRTPLTVARGHLEVLARTGMSDEAAVEEAITVAITELDRMGRLIERLLALGRAREPTRYDAHPVDLRTFLGDLVAAGEVLAGRRWVLGPVPDVVGYFDETEVRGALLNLVDNAVRATGPGDTIRLSATAGAWLSLTVEDSGPGIAERDRDGILDRFARRGSHASGGTGLGLAIVSAVCQAHGGSVRIGTSSLGGASVTMQLGRIGHEAELEAPCES